MCQYFYYYFACLLLLLLGVHVLLQKENIQGVALHSQMNQQNREKQLNLFRSGKCPILLATDVAARGIHINNVFYVINYDFPGSLEQVRMFMLKSEHECDYRLHSLISSSFRRIPPTVCPSMWESW